MARYFVLREGGISCGIHLPGTICWVGLERKAEATATATTTTMATDGKLVAMGSVEVSRLTCAAWG